MEEDGVLPSNDVGHAIPIVGHLAGERRKQDELLY